jgi:Sigma-70, region 4
MTPNCNHSLPIRSAWRCWSLDSLQPAERLAFVLHDMFGVPFEDIAHIIDKSPAAARQLASRARRRVQGAPTVPDPNLATQRRVVDAFLATSRAGDFDALIDILDPDVVFRPDAGSRTVPAASRCSWGHTTSPRRQPHKDRDSHSIASQHSSTAPQVSSCAAGPPPWPSSNSP